ncbi:malto-oligosyltrehalose trehalohydrolase [Streptomyces sp. H10-C2]|uniref:malto-oligosyltrehalose trehalohydrolase n=1 Tax=unclassified Streptomyces TaxID=2593676 RepID=UPI0024B9B48A|nr:MULTISPECIES: malto-oligosyltrehalose trehalohydrolase [unclassified Streptomyces]MDJ0340690.1 malto-oligosyltrehalose trehalohydrolase [Streptomyces sp. PH10-H1]MDJ0372038.1 malto-oligosyltrehalose trehalohydrolase [Streptomyces sp. H10-C2]
MQFEVWAPDAARAEVVTEGRTHPLEPDPDREGWWRAEAPAAPGARYAYVLDGGPPLPDPRSRCQPDGPDGASAVLDHAAFDWTRPWNGRPLPGAVLYELHIGTFTREGTFEAAIGRLPHLAGLGVTHVELMPVCPFPGTHGWGYEGVSLWAVHEPYGGPDGLKRFVDAAHAHGLGVVLDVVHNHLGPSGNHLPAFGPYFTDRHHTPWGDAVNLDAPGSDEVRAYLIGSALAWLRDYRLDGLRLDAVHALVDTRALQFLEELSAAVDTLAASLGRPLFLIAESDLNDPRTTTPREAGGLGLTAQWNDDLHHALHTALTGESQGYYADFAREPLGALAKTLTRVFFHDGTYSSFRGRRHGRPVDRATTPAHRFLGYSQTHDQIGNRATGDRLAPGQLALAAAIVLTSPFTPMLFMGEEWGAGTPWQFFTDHEDPELAAAITRGRRREFAGHGWAAEDIPDPQDPATRLRSCLDWDESFRDPHARLLSWYRELIALRHAEPELSGGGPAAPGVTATGTLLTVRRGRFLTAVNFSDAPAAVPLDRGYAARAEIAAAWLPCEPPGPAGVLHLPARSAAILRSTVDG